MLEIERRGLHTVGLYRKPGLQAAINNLKSVITSVGEYTNLLFPYNGDLVLFGGAEPRKEWMYTGSWFDSHFKNWNSLSGYGLGFLILSFSSNVL